MFRVLRSLLLYNVLIFVMFSFCGGNEQQSLGAVPQFFNMLLSFSYRSRFKRTVMVPFYPLSIHMDAKLCILFGLTHFKLRRQHLCLEWNHWSQQKYQTKCTISKLVSHFWLDDCYLFRCNLWPMFRIVAHSDIVSTLQLHPWEWCWAETVSVEIQSHKYLMCKM